VLELDFNSDRLAGADEVAFLIEGPDLFFFGSRIFEDVVPIAQILRSEEIDGFRF
jgi:hypothetical protein